MHAHNHMQRVLDRFLVDFLHCLWRPSDCVRTLVPTGWPWHQHILLMTNAIVSESQAIVSSLHSGTVGRLPVGLLGEVYRVG